jgi:hypothetical protein
MDASLGKSCVLDSSNKHPRIKLGLDKKKKEYFSSSDGSSPFVITQGVLQSEKWTPEYLAERQTKLLEKLRAIWQLYPAQTKSQEAADREPTKGSWEFTDNKLIERKRDMIMRALSRREGV